MQLTGQSEEIYREVNLSNMQWMVIGQCIEAFTATYRTRQSEVIATYVTRGQLDFASEEATKMNHMLAYLDDLQVAIM
jgi:hypothetical protein